MRILVCVKQVFEPATVKISRSREEFDLRQAVKGTNPVDRYAIEAALRLRETMGGEVVALTVGDSNAEDCLREAVAMGADRGLLLAGPDLAATGEAGLTRAILAGLEHIGGVDLVLTGATSPVDGTGSLPGRLAAALGWPLVLDVACLETDREGRVQAIVAGRAAAWVVPLPGPAVVAVIPGSDRPRYPLAGRIANAYQPGLVEICAAAGLGLDAAALAPDSETGGLVLGAERAPGQVLAGSVDDAVSGVVEILRARRVISA